MGRHFISVLGTGNYQPVHYEGDSKQAEYIQDALVRINLPDLNDEDRITIFLTERAKSYNFEDCDHELRTSEKTGNKITTTVEYEPHKGLKSIWKEQGIDEKILKCVDIPDGANEEEMMLVIRRIYEAIRPGDTLYVDVTHGLRSLPIQMLAAISFTQAMKNIKVEGIYYGAFELKKKQEDGTFLAPVFNLLPFMDIINLSHAVNSFTKYGDSSEMYDLINKQKGSLFASGFKKEGEELNHLVRVFGGIQNITKCLDVSLGCYTDNPKFGDKMSKEDRSIHRAYRNYSSKRNEYINSRDSELKGMGYIMDLLAEQIDDQVKVFDDETNFETGLHAIEWAIKYHKVQQGLTALEETVTTYLCNYYGLDETNRHERVFCKRVITNKYELTEKKKIKDNLEQRVLEIMKDSIMDEQNIPEHRKEELILLVPEIVTTVSDKLIEVAHNVSDNRNSINHFGFSVLGENGYKNYEANLITYYKNFKEAMIEMDAKKVS